jgi:hypothetical protein
MRMELRLSTTMPPIRRAQGQVLACAGTHTAAVYVVARSYNDQLLRQHLN